MPPLPILSGPELIRVLRAYGWATVRQSGSHVQLRNGGMMVTVPLHAEIKRGTLKSILRSTGLSVEQINLAR